MYPETATPICIVPAPDPQLTIQVTTHPACRIFASTNAVHGMNKKTARNVYLFSLRIRMARDNLLRNETINGERTTRRPDVPVASQHAEPLLKLPRGTKAFVEGIVYHTTTMLSTFVLTFDKS